VIQKEKENKFKKIFAGKRIVLLLVFLCFIGLLFCCVGYSVQAQTTTPSNTGMTNYMTGSDAGNKAMTAANKGGSGGNNWSIGGALLGVLNGFLYAVFKVVAAIVMIAAKLFDWAVNPNNFNEVMKMNSIKLGWVIFRDFLNLFFILVLLFSAFCTIFQVEKYHIVKKNILLMVVIMALLVNFSFPVSRFIIDAGNVPMYHFLKVIGGDSGSISKKLWNDANGNAGMQEMLLPNVENFGGIKGSGDQTFSLIAAITFLFIFGITLLVIAVLLVIRILVLALLIMSSPIGFVGPIFPAFKGYADSWWEQLFKQSFFGTIMAFMLYISLLVMEDSQNGFKTISTSASSIGASNDFSSVIVGGVTLAIPIVLLWIAIIAAQKMGAAGAKEVGGFAQKFAKGAMKKFSGFNAVKKQVDAFKASRKKREDEKNKTRWGGKLGDKLNKGQDTVLSHVPGFSKDAKKRLKNVKNSAFDEDAKKATDKYDTSATNSLVLYLNNAANVTNASNPNNRSDAVEYAGRYKQLITDPVRKTEFEAQIRIANQTAASTAATTAGITDPADRTAFIEAYVQREIASAWGTLKTNYNTVKTAHTTA
jgi:hypothetical protein